jgi:multisubunit Na+/H+ antiporter MnhE subunit
MGKRMIFALLVLTLLWVILMEELSIMSVAIGVLTGVFATLFSRRFLPYQQIENVNFYKLLTYPFFLIGQIYVAGFMVIKIFIKGAVVEIVTVKTKLKNEALRVILADSITLTPGSILLDLEENNITLLWMKDKKTKTDPESAGELLKGKLERRLLKAERDA